MGTLFVVGTPIGNLEDISLRALRVLREASLIAAEDTRRARKLLSRYEIDTPVISYFEHSELDRQEAILAALAEGDVALISEAGMPGLSDPGYDLIREAIRRDIPVVPVPGPTALVSALVVSGLPTDSFVYLGFLPRRSGERRHVLRAVQREGRTLVFYEAPHRLLDTLHDLLDVLGDRPVAVARELTKIYEEVFRGPVSAAIVRFDAAAPRGEFTVVVQGLSRDEKPVEVDETQVLTIARQLVADGLSAKSAAAEAAERTGWSRRRVYELLHRG